MPDKDLGADDCPFCLLMRKADEINRLSRRNASLKSGGFRAVGDILDEKGFNKH